MASNITPVDIQRFLGGIDYPATKQELIDYATNKGADNDILDFMAKLPDRSYDDPAELSKAAGELLREP
ncbi:MAG: DUF2795 domain-containing protein [Patescibacteria group bacterium]|nr:DUF2795 domain-containing protein [Patescibacteria group bacterium]